MIDKKTYVGRDCADRNHFTFHGVGEAIRNMTEKYVEGMKALKAQQGDPNNATAEDQILLSATEHVRRKMGNGKQESFNELVARTGISPGQVRTMSRHEIATFCAAAEAREQDEIRISGHSATLAEDRPQINSRFVMVP